MSDYIERYWRDATPADAIKEPPMVARFRDSQDGEWKWDGILLGIDRSVISGCVWCAKNAAFRYCQVYDAPDPGEGWRLIDPEKDDYNQDGVEYWCIGQKRWLPRYLHNDKTLFLQDGFYRIRIEQPKSEPRYEPFKWEDREQLRGRWITWKHDNGWMIESQIDHLNEHKNGGLWFKSHDAKWLLGNAKFLDTGEPVGKRVQ